MNSIFHRISVRKYEDRPVEKEKIMEILKAGMQAPSACNQQPWEFFVVTDKEKIQKLSKVTPYTGCAAGAPVVIVPVYHTEGWQIRNELDSLRKTEPIDKETFGSTDLADDLVAMNIDDEIESITFVGLCTDICVISNALLVKAALPEVPIIVDAACCAGVTPESHENALNAMKMCQIDIVR